MYPKHISFSLKSKQVCIISPSPHASAINNIDVSLFWSGFLIWLFINGNTEQWMELELILERRVLWVLEFALTPVGNEIQCSIPAHFRIPPCEEHCLAHSPVFCSIYSAFRFPSVNCASCGTRSGAVRAGLLSDGRHLAWVMNWIPLLPANNKDFTSFLWMEIALGSKQQQFRCSNIWW